jgi:dihydroflavonol-4-reductase
LKVVVNISYEVSRPIASTGYPLQLSASTAMSKGKVCVSGVTGFLGGHIVKCLLAAGYTVHGTARRIEDPSRLVHITELPGASTSFRAFEADILTPGSFNEALAGCDSAIHCASPYTLQDYRDPHERIVEPALKGTIFFLDGCRAAGTVRKVIVTSSAAAITDEGGHGAIFNENDWNEKSTAYRLTYYYSKVLSEKAAWKWAEANPDIKLVTINPSFILGPSLVKTVNTSPQILRTIIDGHEFPGILDLTYTFVDVRDVARAHVAALESSVASGRYICANSDKTMHFRDVVTQLQRMGYKPNMVSEKSHLCGTTV